MCAKIFFNPFTRFCFFVLFCFVLFCFVLFFWFVSFRFVSFRFVSFRFVSFCFVLFCFCFVFVFVFFLTPFGDLPPAGKLHRSGEEMQTSSLLSLTITLPSETNSYCAIASRTSTTIRSKYQ